MSRADETEVLNDPEADALKLYGEHVWARSRVVRRLWRGLWRLTSKDFRQYEFLRLPKERRVAIVMAQAQNVERGAYFRTLPELGDLVGRQDEVNFFLNMIYYHILRHPEAMSLSAPPKVVLVKGEPGSGKSFLVKAVMKEAFRRAVEEGFILDLKTLEGAQVNSPWMGMYSGAISSAFQDAQKRPTFLWIDEAQQLVQKGSNMQGDSASKEYQQAESAILTALDMIMASPVRTVVVMGSNTSESIREDVRRRAFLLDLDSPGLNHDAMVEIVRKKLEKMNIALDAAVVLDALEQELRGLGENKIVPHDITRAFDEVMAESERPVRSRFINRLKGENVERTPITVDSFKKIANKVRAYKEQMMTQAAQESFQNVPPPDRYADVGGLDGIKSEVIKEVTLSLHPSMAGDRWKQPRGYLFYGPGGTGKTLLARAIAGENKVPISVVNAASLMSGLVGESEKSLRNVFTKARSCAPSIIFMDEIDTIGRARGTALGGASNVTESMLTTLLTQLDGFSPKGRVVFIGATNRRDVLDPALVQRLDKQFEFTFPKTTAEKLDVIKAQLRSEKVDSLDPADVLRLFMARTFSPRESADTIKEASRMAQMEQIACAQILKAEEELDFEAQKKLRDNFKEEYKRLLDLDLDAFVRAGNASDSWEPDYQGIYSRVAASNPVNMVHLSMAFEKKVVTDAERDSRRYARMHRSDADEVGKGYGLATNEDGTKGIFLTLECSFYPAKKPGDGRIVALGNLGVGAKESIEIARQLIRKYSPSITDYDCVLHVISQGEGGESAAISGPSAGQAMLFTMLSAWLGIPYCRDVCMTGKVDLNGIVGIVGGIQPKRGAGKLDAARDNGFKVVLIPMAAYEDLVRDWEDFLDASAKAGTVIFGGKTWLDYAVHVFPGVGDLEARLRKAPALNTSPTPDTGT